MKHYDEWLTEVKRLMYEKDVGTECFKVLKSECEKKTEDDIGRIEWYYNQGLSPMDFVNQWSMRPY